MIVYSTKSVCLCLVARTRRGERKKRIAPTLLSKKRSSLIFRIQIELGLAHAVRYWCEYLRSLLADVHKNRIQSVACMWLCNFSSLVGKTIGGDGGGSGTRVSIVRDRKHSIRHWLITHSTWFYFLHIKITEPRNCSAPNFDRYCWAVVESTMGIRKNNLQTSAPFKANGKWQWKHKNLRNEQRSDSHTNCAMQQLTLYWSAGVCCSIEAAATMPMLMLCCAVLCLSKCECTFCCGSAWIAFNVYRWLIYTM